MSNAPPGIDLPGEAATRAAGAALAAVLRAGDVVTLAGTLGMGKTSLARGVLHALGLAGEAASPTFPIVLPYAPPAVRLPVAHVDLYRLDDAAEAEELGLEEFLDDGVLLIEWPDRGPPWRDALALSLAPGAAGAALDLARAGGMGGAMAPGRTGDDVMIPRADAARFLDAAGWAGAAVTPLAGDASFRRYFRVEGARGQAVLMDAPPPHEDVRPFVAVARHLAGHGFAAPAILHADAEAGFLLLEDFGDVLMARAVAADPAGEHAVYARAVDTLKAVQAAPVADVPPYDRAVILREAGLLTEWYAPAVGLTVDTAGYEAAWHAVFDALEPAPPVTVLRDYHAENLMPLADGRLGLLDFQDALAGHPAYDLVSLLQDARRDVAPALEAAMIRRFGPLDPAAYAAWGAQRNAKILGIFTRLWTRDGKDRYLAFQPRVWRYLERDLDHPALAPVRDWFDANLPRHARAAYWADHAA